MNSICDVNALSLTKEKIKSVVDLAQTVPDVTLVPSTVELLLPQLTHTNFTGCTTETNEI